MRTILCWRFFEFRARREESADLARNRDSRRSRTPLAAESMNAKNANIEGSALLPGTRWCKKKIVAISFEEGVVFRSRVLARTLLYVFLATSMFFCWFFRITWRTTVHVLLIFHTFVYLRTSVLNMNMHA
jgi:hypothetical protein